VNAAVLISQRHLLDVGTKPRDVLFGEFQQPLHNLLPLCSIRIHFMTVDTSVLYGILADANIIDSKKCSGASFEKLGMEHWNSTFSIMPIQGQHATFTGTVDTVSIQPQRGRHSPGAV
jgi:hypothetical protein